MTRRFVALVCVVWVLGALAVAFGAGRARAAAPRDQGWWTVTSVAVPGAPVPIPASVDVPARGLLVQGGPNAPTAYSALLYELDPGTTASSLTLAVAPNSLTNPAASVQVCHLLQPINHPEQGGPLTDGPPYDCSKNVTATPTANAYKFDVSGMVVDNMVAVAILPAGPTDRVVFNAPDDSSLGTTAGSAASDSGSAAGDTAPVGSSDSIPTTGSDVVGSSAPVGGGFAGDSTPPVPVGDSAIAAPAPAVTPSGSANNLPFVPAATASPEKATPIAVILLIAGVIGGAILWAFAGRQRARPVLP